MTSCAPVLQALMTNGLVVGHEVLAELSVARPPGHSLEVFVLNLASSL